MVEEVKVPEKAPKETASAPAKAKGGKVAIDGRKGTHPHWKARMRGRASREREMVSHGP